METIEAHRADDMINQCLKLLIDRSVPEYRKVLIRNKIQETIRLKQLPADPPPILLHLQTENDRLKKKMVWLESLLEMKDKQIRNLESKEGLE